MRHEYCTLFDSNYLARGLTLYRSLERCDDDFVLRAVCMDTESRELLSRLSLPRMRILAIDEVERAYPDLLAARSTRTPWEYCWTATAAVCEFILDQEPAIGLLTYLDADMSFSSTPEPLFRELGDGSIMLISHRNDETPGVYNVGWVSFRNDANGRAALAWWRARCIEWCFDRVEEDRYGDQKYLDDWPERFDGVKVCSNDGAGLAPWNDKLHQLSVGHSGEVLVDRAPLIFYHHAGLQVHRGETVSGRLARGFRRFSVTRGPARLTWSIAYDVPSQAIELVWEPYVAQLAEAVEELREVGAPATLGMRLTPLREAAGTLWFRSPLKPLRHAFRRTPIRFQERVRRVASPR